MNEVQPVTVTLPLVCKGDPSDMPDRPVCLDEAPERPGEGGQRIVCAACGNLVTNTAAKVEVNGSHRHVFFNPHGIMFELGCFMAAPGTIRTGPPVEEFTWFSGHSWQITICGRCNVHLGWYYETSFSGFYGLILPALREEEG